MCGSTAAMRSSACDWPTICRSINDFRFSTVLTWSAIIRPTGMPVHAATVSLIACELTSA